MGGMRTIGRDVARQVAKKLTELQGDRTDGDMATILGCTRPHYWQIKNGRKFINYEMTKRAVSTFPEVLPIVIRDLAGTAS